MAEDEGFEPPQTESESGVLPLHKSSIARTDIIIHKVPELSIPFFENSQIFSNGTPLSLNSGLIVPTEREFHSRLPALNSEMSLSPLYRAAW